MLKHNLGALSALDIFPLLIQGHNCVLVKHVSEISDLDGLRNSSTISKLQCREVHMLKTQK